MANLPFPTEGCDLHISPCIAGELLACVKQRQSFNLLSLSQAASRIMASRVCATSALSTYSSKVMCRSITPLEVISIIRFTTVRKNSRSWDQKCRLSCTVGADKSVAVARCKLYIDILEQNFLAVSQGDIGCANHCRFVSLSLNKKPQERILRFKKRVFIIYPQ